MNLQHRLNLLFELGKYFDAKGCEWGEVKEKASSENGWFTPEFIDLAMDNIVSEFLDPEKLLEFASRNQIPDTHPDPKTVGLVMAGNVPLVGFHDWLCIFLSGHKTTIKPSAKDEVLIRHIIEKLTEWDSKMANQSQFAAMLKGCDAYIATGSNNSARYFEYYFNKFPAIIRRNRTSVAILNGTETSNDLERLADDVHQYFGLGCRNVTKLFVPRDYVFVPLLDSFRKYSHFVDHNKYKNNYDYQLALALLNNTFYMTNGSILLIENESTFSPISQLHYQFYTPGEHKIDLLENKNDIQCVIGDGFVPFGRAQNPGLGDFADGVNTLEFLLNMKPNR